MVSKSVKASIAGNKAEALSGGLNRFDLHTEPPWFRIGNTGIESGISEGL